MIDPFKALLEHNIKDLNAYLSHGNINCVDKHGKSLLIWAIRLEDTEAVQLLLRSYIDIDIADEDGNTCFHYAVKHNRVSYLRILFTISGNPMTRNKNGQTPLYLACRYGKEQIIDLYLEKYQLDMGEKDFKEETILMAFVRSKSVKLLRKYGNFSLWLEEKNYLGNTPLMVACEKNAYTMVYFLLEHSIFLNALNHHGETALFFAVRNGNKRIIDLLLKAGAFLDFKNKNCETIYTIASPEIKEYIEERARFYKLDTYKKKYPLHYAIYLQDQGKIDKALSLKTIYIEDFFGFTPTKLAQYFQNKKLLTKIKEMQRLAKLAAFETK